MARSPWIVWTICLARRCLFAAYCVTRSVCAARTITFTFRLKESIKVANVMRIRNDASQECERWTTHYLQGGRFLHWKACIARVCVRRLHWISFGSEFKLVNFCNEAKIKSLLFISCQLVGNLLGLTCAVTRRIGWKLILICIAIFTLTIRLIICDTKRSKGRFFSFYGLTRNQCCRIRMPISPARTSDLNHWF